MNRTCRLLSYTVILLKGGLSLQILFEDWEKNVFALAPRHAGLAVLGLVQILL
jgi:hypothetical protein